MALQAYRRWIIFSEFLRLFRPICNNNTEVTISSGSVTTGHARSDDPAEELLLSVLPWLPPWLTRLRSLGGRRPRSQTILTNAISANDLPYDFAVNPVVLASWWFVAQISCHLSCPNALGCSNSASLSLFYLICIDIIFFLNSKLVLSASLHIHSSVSPVF